MSKKHFNWLLEIAISLSVISCELNNNDDNYTRFRIDFSDGTRISENQILFYDSSTHFLFLKSDIEFNTLVEGFEVLVNSKLIYEGAFRSCLFPYISELPYYIYDCFPFGKSIIELGYSKYKFSPQIDLRNDERIIDALFKSNLLMHGIRCTIDSIKVFNVDKYSEATLYYSVTNNDNISYYILDPFKLGNQHFSYYMGGLTFKNSDTGISYSTSYSQINLPYEEIFISDFLVLPGNSKMSFSVGPLKHSKLEAGIYQVSFTFCGINEDNINKFNLSLENGRIWVGESNIVTQNFKVN